MNEKLLSILSTMFPSLPESKDLGTMGARQFHFFTETHECSITAFEPATGSEEKDLATMKHYNRFDNDVQWLGNVRFSATSL